MWEATLAIRRVARINGGTRRNRGFANRPFCDRAEDYIPAKVENNSSTCESRASQ